MTDLQITYCRMCECFCGLRVELDRGRVGRIHGDPDHPLSQGHLCVKGKALGDLHHDPDRLRQPVRREPGGAWQPVTWETALDEVASRLLELRDRYGPGSVAVFFGLGSFYSSLTQPVAQQFVRGFGIGNVYSTMTIDCAALNRAAGEVLGDPFYIPLPDWERSRYMLLLGHNPLASRFGQFQSLPRGVEQLRTARAAGGRLITVDPRRTESAHQADEHHFIIPGRDVFLVLGLLHVVMTEGLYDREFIARHTDGVDALQEAVRPWTPERVAPLTRIDAGTIRRLAREFATADGAFCIGHTGVSQGPHGTLAEWAIFALNAVTGNLDRPGGLRWCEPTTQYLPAGRTRRAVPAAPASRIGNWRRFLGEFPVATLADEILTPGPDQVRALVVIGGNPALSLPNGDKIARALARLDLLVSIDLYVNQTGAFAHYVLPAADQLERAEVSHPMIARNSDMPFVQYTPALVAPVGDVREEWQIFRDLNRRLGIPEFGNPELESQVHALEAAGNSIADVKEVLLNQMLAPGGLTVSELQGHPHGLVVGERAFGQMREKGWPTPNGKVHLAPEAMLEGLRSLEPAEGGHADRSFLLIGRRIVSGYNSGLRNLPSLHKVVPENEALLNDGDAVRIGVEAGQYVTIHNRVGRIRIKVRPTGDVAPGVVVVPHGWGHVHPSGQNLARKTPGANVNVLIDDERDLEVFTGNPWQNGTRVWITQED